MAPPDDLAAEHPQMVAMAAQDLVGELPGEQVDQEGLKYIDDGPADGDIGFFNAPGPGPVRQVRNVAFEGVRHAGCDNRCVTDSCVLPDHAADPPAQCLPSLSRLLVPG